MAHGLTCYVAKLLAFLTVDGFVGELSLGSYMSNDCTVRPLPGAITRLACLLSVNLRPWTYPAAS